MSVGGGVDWIAPVDAASLRRVDGDDCHFVNEAAAADGAHVECHQMFGVN